MTLGAFLVYASPTDLEGECATVAGARRMVAKLTRLGFTPSVRRHAWTDDGHTNIDCDLDGEILPAPVPGVAPAAPVAPAPLRPAYHEIRREEWPNGSAIVLPFAVRVF